MRIRLLQPGAEFSFFTTATWVNLARGVVVVLKGDLVADPTVIRSPTIVFKDGIGYDSAKLIEAVQGRVGIN